MEEEEIVTIEETKDPRLITEIKKGLDMNLKVRESRIFVQETVGVLIMTTLIEEVHFVRIGAK